MGYMPVLVASGFFVLIHHSATGTHLYQPATRFGSETAPGLAQFRV